jgi:regulation of enolase protein 1 (concanavalin A-like superfamily)
MTEGTRLAAGLLIGVSLTATTAPRSAAQAPAPAAPTPPAACQAGRRDDFTGATLDRSRWTTVVRETPDLRLADGHLVIPTSNTDIIFTPGRTAYTDSATPNLVLQALPQGPFTATAKLTLQARQPFQQAGLVIYRDDDNYTKAVLVFARNRSGGGARYIALIREDDGEVSQAASGPLGEDFPDSLWIRLTSDGETLQAAYSADGTRFTNVPESADDGMPLRLTGGASPKIGLIALSGGKTQAPVIDATFDWFELCPGGNAARID